MDTFEVTYRLRDWYFGIHKIKFSVWVLTNKSKVREQGYI